MFFFTADLHFDHKDIIEVCERPFQSIEEMNSELTRRWNSKVTDRDTVYVIGDFKFTSQHNLKQMLNTLNGITVILRGNHDRNNGVKSLLDKVIVTEYFGKRVIMAHDPEDAFGTPFDLGLVGHVHKAWKFKQSMGRLLVNVGVDVWDYYPVTMQQIIKAVKKWEVMNEIQKNE